MGQTLQQLAERPLGTKAIFNNRFVVEICEQVHVHYRNLRIVLSLHDWQAMAEGMADALKRWNERSQPETAPGKHIELCRKFVAGSAADNAVKINLNKNLYEVNAGKIFADGAGLDAKTYVHLKIRDLRIELTNDEYTALEQAVLEAKEARCLT